MRRVRLIVLLAALAGVAAFVAPLDDGRPMFEIAEVKAKLLSAAPGGAVAAGGEEGGVYKWKDENGTWHYSNVRPEGRGGVQKVKETITWATGSGGGAAGDEAATEEPRSAAQLLSESKRLDETSAARETEMDRLVREAQQ